MKRTYYMHTLDGKPAGYDRHVGYVFFAIGEISTNHMAKTLRALRKQQANDTSKVDRKFGYIRVVVEL